MASITAIWIPEDSAFGDADNLRSAAAVVDKMGVAIGGVDFTVGIGTKGRLAFLADYEPAERRILIGHIAQTSVFTDWDVVEGGWLTQSVNLLALSVETALFDWEIHAGIPPAEAGGDDAGDDAGDDKGGAAAEIINPDNDDMLEFWLAERAKFQKLLSALSRDGVTSMTTSDGTTTETMSAAQISAAINNCNFHIVVIRAKQPGAVRQTYRLPC